MGFKMQVILIVLPVVSMIAAAAGGKMGELSAAVLGKSSEAVELVISLCGVLCFWSGIMNVARKAGLVEKLSRALSPVVGALFRGVKRGGRAAGLITLNLATNILGLGNASTPFGIAAMKAIAEENAGFSDAATDDMIMLAVLNTASLQLIPTTAAALRAANGSAKPFEILPCVWIVSIYSAVIVVASVKLMGIISRKRLE